MILCEVNACAMYQTENVYKTVETNSITTLSLFIWCPYIWLQTATEQQCGLIYWWCQCTATTQGSDNSLLFPTHM